ncbi:GspH/FimT family pseudopilin [bacterium]|nr:GspH/FimT family pseudopilin [bacterium]
MNVKISAIVRPVPQVIHNGVAYCTVNKNANHGFTLLELLVAVAILAILMSIGLPSFTAAVKNSRLSAAANCLSTAVYSARSEAVKRSANVTVCPYDDDTSCGSDWTKGALVFSEGSSAANTADLDGAEVDTDSTVLRICTISADDIEISATASTDRTPGSATTREFIRYSRDGVSNWKLGYFCVGDDRSSDNWKGFNIGLSGDIRAARLSSDNTALKDVFNRDMSSC